MKELKAKKIKYSHFIKKGVDEYPVELREDLLRLTDEFKSIEQELIDNNLITKFEKATLGKIDEADPHLTKPLEEEIEKSIKQEISEKMFGEPEYYKKHGGLVGIRHLTRPI